VTFVAARVRGQVSRVLVDDNNRIHKGDVLVELDKEPYQDAVAVRRAAVDTAKADLRAATAMVLGIEAQARSRRWNLQHAMEDVGNQISLLRSRIAIVDKNQAELDLRYCEDRARRLVRRRLRSPGIRQTSRRCRCPMLLGPGASPSIPSVFLWDCLHNQGAQISPSAPSRSRQHGLAGAKAGSSECGRGRLREPYGQTPKQMRRV
jgi:hypothetical protein